MWKHCCLFVCALVAFVAGTGSGPSAQDPTSQPLVQFADLQYIGAFRLPRAAINGDDLSFGGKPFAFNPARNSLFVGSKAGRVAEVSIPELVNSVDVDSMFFAKYVQGLSDPLEGNIWQVGGDASIEGVLVDGDRLLGTAATYYDALNSQRVSHYKRSTNLTTQSFNGFVPMWQPDHMGFVSGYMATVPPEWRAKLGGPAISGQCCTPIAWKTSWGPAAFAFNPADIGAVSPVPATPLLYYSHDHPTLGIWEQSGAAYGGTARVNGVALIAGTRTALFFGSIGTGTPCYGNGTSDQTLHNTSSHDGTLWCYDPTSTDKGQHAFPYRYQIWAYDLNELAAVKEGRKQPWDVKPYGVWPFELPIPEIHAKIGGVAYDAQRQVLYISQLLADKDTFANRALIHTLRINSAPASLPAPTATTGPTPSGSGAVKSVTLSANRPSPQAPGTTITWTATPSGGISPYEYKWLSNDGSGWASGNWTTSNTFTWTPPTAGEYHRVSVWVRSYAATADIGEVSAETYFPISGTPGTPTVPPPTTTPTTPSAKATSVTLSVNKAAPQPAGTAITWTATPTGGVAPHQYQWYTHDGTSWSAGPWTSSNTFVWTPTVAHPYARVSVWVRSAGSTAGIYEVSAEQFFAVSAATTPVPPPPTTTPSAKTTSVTLSVNKAAPQPAGTAITWTATPTGGVGPHQYQWYTNDGTSWSSGPWTNSNTFVWTPTVAHPYARVSVWVRSAGSTAGIYEALAEQYFAVSAATTPVPPPPTTPTPSAKTTAVTLSANKAAPQPAGTAITWMATPTGGVGPHQYQWYTHDGTSWSSGSWTSSNTFVWTPTVAHPYARVSVWVRSAGSTATIYEALAEQFFAVSAPTTPVPPPPTSPTTAKTTSVTLSVNKAAPQPAGTPITWTATPTGGVGPHQYQWYTNDGTSWSSGPWTNSNTFVWTPTVAHPYARVSVWVRSAGSSAGIYEALAEQYFAVSAVTTAKTTSVTLSANRVAPQAVGTAITWTATPTGGIGPHQYQWYTHDGTSWQPAGPWTNSNTFVWIPTVSHPYARVSVWVRSAGSTAGIYEALAEQFFAIK